VEAAQLPYIQQSAAAAAVAPETLSPETPADATFIYDEPPPALRPLLLTVASHVALLALRAGEALPMSPRLRRRSEALGQRLSRMANAGDGLLSQYHTPLQTPPAGPAEARSPRSPLSPLPPRSPRLPPAAHPLLQLGHDGARNTVGAQHTDGRPPDGDRVPAADNVHGLDRPSHGPLNGFGAAPESDEDATYIYDSLPPRLRPALNDIRQRLASFRLPQDARKRLEGVNDALAAAADAARANAGRAKQHVRLNTKGAGGRSTVGEPSPGVQRVREPLPELTQVAPLTPTQPPSSAAG
jgi:hypothetical protein